MEFLKHFVQTQLFYGQQYGFFFSLERKPITSFIHIVKEFHVLGKLVKRNITSPFLQSLFTMLLLILVNIHLTALLKSLPVISHLREKSKVFIEAVKIPPPFQPQGLLYVLALQPGMLLYCSFPGFLCSLLLSHLLKEAFPDNAYPPKIN